MRYKAEKKSEPFKGNQYTQSGERQFVEHQKTSEKIGKQHNEYMRNWRRVNKDKVKQYNKTYWEKKVNEMNQEEKEISS